MRFSELMAAQSTRLRGPRCSPSLSAWCGAGGMRQGRRTLALPARTPHAAPATQVVFRPFAGEVLTGRIKSADASGLQARRGRGQPPWQLQHSGFAADCIRLTFVFVRAYQVSLGFFDDVHIPAASLQEPSVLCASRSARFRCAQLGPALRAAHCQGFEMRRAARVGTCRCEAACYLSSLKLTIKLMCCSDETEQLWKWVYDGSDMFMDLDEEARAMIPSLVAACLRATDACKCTRPGLRFAFACRACAFQTDPYQQKR